MEWIDQIRAGWSSSQVECKPYGSGSWGPTASATLADRGGVTWND